ncbi:MAG: hypothetical protein AABX00_02475 [Nanoarchaeota archaeon]
MNKYKIIVILILFISIIPLSLGVKFASEPYKDKTDILVLSLNGSAERILRSYYFNPTERGVNQPYSFTSDDYFYSNDPHVVDSFGYPLIIDGVQQKVKIENITLNGKQIFRYSFGPVGFYVNAKAADYIEFHEPISRYWNGKNFAIRQKIVTFDEVKNLRVEFKIPKYSQSIFYDYSPFLTKIEPAPNSIYETPNEKIFVWNLGELSLGDFFYIDFEGGYKTSWFPFIDKIIAGIIGFLVAALFGIKLARKK